MTPEQAKRTIARLQHKITLLEAENDMLEMIVHDFGGDKIEAHIRAKFPTIPHSSRPTSDTPAQESAS